MNISRNIWLSPCGEKFRIRTFWASEIYAYSTLLSENSVWKCWMNNEHTTYSYFNWRDENLSFISYNFWMIWDKSCNFSSTLQPDISTRDWLPERNFWPPFFLQFLTTGNFIPCTCSIYNYIIPISISSIHFSIQIYCQCSTFYG